MTAVIAVDPSLTSTGVARWTPDGRIVVRTISTTPRDGPREVRHHHIVMGVLAMRSTTGPTLVTMEARITPPPEAVETAMNLAELRGVLNHGVSRSGCTRAEVHPSTLKGYATGRGNSSKADMILSARGRLGDLSYCANDDEADALWLLAMTMEHLGQPLVALPARNRKFVGNVTWPRFTIDTRVGVTA